MNLTGIRVRDELVLQLARLVDDTLLAERLEDAYRRDAKELGLEIHEREQILRALDDPPDGLTELRAVLLQDVIAWRREGLA